MMMRVLPRPAALAGMAVLAIALAWQASQVHAALPDNVQAKVETYKKKLVEWAAHPTIVKAVRESNAKGGPLPGMNNGKWDALSDTDPLVTGLLSTPASTLVKQWEADKNINKLFVRDEKGNMVAGSAKSLLYNASARPPFKEGMKGKPWGADEIKPDPTTQIKSVHISAPILDGGGVIGIIHSAVTAE
jgi:hypothetical protein